MQAAVKSALDPLDPFTPGKIFGDPSDAAGSLSCDARRRYRDSGETITTANGVSQRIFLRSSIANTRAPGTSGTQTVISR